MIRTGFDQARTLALVKVPIGGGRRVELAVSLAFGPDGTVRSIAAAPATEPGAEAREAIRAVLELQAVLRQNQLGQVALREKLEARLHLVDQLEAIEALRGPEARRRLAEEAA